MCMKWNDAHICISRTCMSSCNLALNLSHLLAAADGYSNTKI